MKCKHCGALLIEGAKFCGICGASIPGSIPDDSTVLLNTAPGAERANDGTVLLNTAPGAERANDGTVLLNTAPGAGESDDSTVLLNTAPGTERANDGTVLLNTAPGTGESDDSTVLLNTAPGTERANDSTVLLNYQTRAVEGVGMKPKKPSKKNSRIPFIVAVAITAVLCLGAGAYYFSRIETTDDILIQAEQNVSSGNFDAALFDYDRLLAKDPLNVSAYKGKANLFIKQEKYEEAEAVLRDGFSKTNDSDLWDIYQELIQRNTGDS